MRMKPLTLDFQDGPWFGYRGGVTILLSSIVIALFISGVHVFTILEIRNQESIWLKTQNHGAVGGKEVSRAGVGTVDRLKPELKRANEIVQQLAMPWDQLFDAIEVFDPEQVALLRIETDMSRHVLTINAVSKTFNGMLGYMRNLNKQTSLLDVYLIDHKVLTEDESKPVRFSISTSWNNEGVHK